MLTWKRTIAIVIISGLLTLPAQAGGDGTWKWRAEPEGVPDARPTGPGMAGEDAAFDARSGHADRGTEAAVAFSPAPFIDLFAGYRFPERDAARRGILADTHFEGPYLGAAIRF